MQRRKQVDKVERGLVCAVDRHGTEWLAFVNFLDMNVFFFLSMVKLFLEWAGMQDDFDNTCLRPWHECYVALNHLPS